MERNINNDQTRWATYHQGYDPIYNASYEFGFVFVDEDEVDNEDEFYEEDEETLTLH